MRLDTDTAPWNERMQTRHIWWFDACDTEVIADFRRRSLLMLDIDPAAGDVSAARQKRFEEGIAVGDLVVAADRETHALLIGEVQTAASRRPGLACMQTLRGIHWYDELPEDACGRALPTTMHALPALSILDDALHGAVDAALELNAANDDTQPLHFEVECAPPAVTLPSLPILYQSPYAEQILRDFRWREYLLANPDVAATGDTEAHAFGHFFHQGYYERRIFDPKRLDGFDPGYYRERYPDIALANDSEAQIHYCYQGWYEQRVPNRDSAWLYDAELHVFQMGKVGSHAISDALQNAGYGGRVIHLHWVTDLIHGYPSNRLPYSSILVHPRERPVKVISAAREIVSWTLSGMFQYLGAATVNVADAVAMVEERFWNQSQNGLRWFDHGYFCGLDVYAHPFDHPSGWCRIQHHGIDLLLYRQEDLPRMEAPFATFLEMDALRLSRHNVGDDKGYADLYRRVMRDFRLPGNLLSSLYDSAYMRHFYSDVERERAYARWVRAS
jgi:Putative capsular polysaccharide synthesis protein